MSTFPPSHASARLADHLADADAIFSDVWGVVHDGLAAIPSACEALVKAREAGRPVILVSNAPRPAAAVAAMLDRLGVPRAAYDRILTSGDLTRDHLAADTWAWVHHVGPDRDMPIYDGLELTFCDPEEADVAVVTGLLDDETETAADYRPLCEQLAAFDVPMVCANPDLVVERGEKLIVCAGAIAAIYETMGGAVTYLGKPHRPVYERGHRLLSDLAGKDLDPARILAIGDAVRTDVKGAVGYGMPVIFLAGGIHAKDAGGADAIDHAALERAYAAEKARPTAVGWRLVW